MISCFFHLPRLTEREGGACGAEKRVRGRGGEERGGGSSLLRWERLRSGTRRGREPLFTPVVLQAEAGAVCPTRTGRAAASRGPKGGGSCFECKVTLSQYGTLPGAARGEGRK